MHNNIKYLNFLRLIQMDVPILWDCYIDDFIRLKEEYGADDPDNLKKIIYYMDLKYDYISPSDILKYCFNFESVDEFPTEELKSEFESLMSDYNYAQCEDYKKSYDSKVFDFITKLDNLLLEGNLSQEEIKKELENYTDFICKTIDYLNAFYEDLSKIVDKKNKLFSNIINSARKLEKEKDYEGAIKLYEENIKIDHTLSGPYERLAILYRKIKDYDNEIRICKLYMKQIESELKELDMYFYVDEISQEEYEKKYIQEEKKELKRKKEFFEIQTKRYEDILSAIEVELEKDEIKLNENKLKRMEQKQNDIKEAYEDMLKRNKELETEINSPDFKIPPKGDTFGVPPLVARYLKYEKRVNRAQELKNSQK